MNRTKIILIAILVFLSIVLTSLLYFSAPVNSKNNEVVLIEVVENESVSSVLENLKVNQLIRSKGFAQLYVKISNKDNFKIGTYSFKQSNSLNEILTILNKGSNSQSNTVMFQEGLRIIDYAKIVEDKLGIKEKEFLKLTNDKEFIKELATKYDLIKDYDFNNKVFFLLEGLFAPDTYQFSSSADAKKVIEVLIAQNNKLYLENKKLFKASKFSLNEIFTLASMAEGEAKSIEDRALVTSIFVNRINKGIPLGSDVTTYYGLQIKMNERHLTSAEFNEVNNYNTRSTMKGLPVGPVNSPNFETVKAVLTHKKTDYMYFVSDKNLKIYGTKTYDEHKKLIEELKSKGLWLTLD